MATSEESSFTYKAVDDIPSADDTNRITGMVPFFMLTFLILPSLLVAAGGRMLTGFAYLLDTGFLGFARHAAWVIVPLAVICGISYIIRGKGVWGRLAAVVLMIVLVATTIFVLAPQS